MKKIGLLCLALVLALGALGIGYAAWTDTINISGSVNTGTVDINVVNWSNTWVWKVVDNASYPDEICIAHQWETDPNNDQAPVGAITSNLWPDGIYHYELAIADSDYNGDDAVLVTFANLFPCIDFTADFLMHYEGTIPVKVNLAEISFSGAPELEQYVTFTWYESDADGTYGRVIENGIGGIQMHYCDYVICAINIHLPQDNTLMNLSGTITGQVQVVQWNEFPYTPSPTP
jgi:predicted ribosomally synthesized peptide with SipW-like signal peptide